MALKCSTGSRTRKCAPWLWSSSRRARCQPRRAFNFCRLAFGAAGSFGALIDTGDAEKVARDIFTNGRTVLQWNCGRRMASRASVKLLLNLCLIAASAVPRGGVVTVDISGEDEAVTMRVEAKEANARLSHSATDFLTNAVPNEPIDGHSI